MDGEVAELPEPLREWVRERAAETGQTPAAVLSRAAAAYRLLEDHEDRLPGPDGFVRAEIERADPETLGEAMDPEAVETAVERTDAGSATTDPASVADALDTDRVADELADRVDADTLTTALDEETLAALIDERIETETAELRERTTTLAQRLSALESDVDEKIDDVRSRVVQVKREADSKAAADHTHESLREEIDAATETIAELEATLTAVDERVEAMRTDVDRTNDRLEAGFDNYEEVLRRLNETASELRDRTDTLASSLSGHRDRLNALEAADTRREAVERLQTEAAEKGVTDAKCGSCATTVHVGLLAAPRCPHCDAPYDGIDADTGLFRGAKLVVADRPALESPE